jgi:3-oxoacyl-[acyl-carrier-protein] synthase III
MTWALEMTEISRRSMEMVAARNGLSLNDVRWFSFDNINQPFLRLQLAEYGVPSERAYLDGFSRFGHAYAADNLINLCDLLSAKSIRGGDRILAQNASRMMSGVFLLERSA